MQGVVTAEFGGEERSFCVVRHKHLFELQERCGVRATTADGDVKIIPAGPLEIFNRFQAGNWRVDDVVQTIRLGLIGGGMSASDAMALVRRELDDVPVGMYAPLASTVLMAGIYGVPGDALGKQKAEPVESEAINASPAPQPTA